MIPSSRTKSSRRNWRLSTKIQAQGKVPYSKSQAQSPKLKSHTQSPKPSVPYPKSQALSPIPIVPCTKSQAQNPMTKVSSTEPIGWSQLTQRCQERCIELFLPFQFLVNSPRHRRNLSRLPARFPAVVAGATARSAHEKRQEQRVDFFLFFQSPVNCPRHRRSLPRLPCPFPAARTARV